MISRFGKFKLLKRIGGRRLSQVFLVSPDFGEGPGPSIALKRVNPSFIGEPAYVKLVVREAGLLTRLGHPNLCACQEMGTIDGCAFFTLDLVDGCTLRALMRPLSQNEMPLAPSAALALVYQLAQVLCYLHNASPIPLVHLDLSPQNVMISREGTLKLIDFGISRQLDGKNPPPLGGKIAGTVGYMSPEQARGAAIDDRADQYGMGILLWELLAGRRLFRGNTVDTWKRMRQGQIPDPSKLLRSSPENLIMLVGRLLRFDPEDRFAHLGDVISFMESFFSSVKSGLKPLSALVEHFLAEPDFDPFDVVFQAEADAGGKDIPQGDGGGEEYAEISILVERGAGTPDGMIRAILPEGADLPESQFLEIESDGETDKAIDALA
jgi:eukaryotic-like serine/threonine-protein kinase